MRHMCSIKNRHRIEQAIPTAVQTRNGRDAPAGLLDIIMDHSPLLVDFDVDRWINEGGALTRQEYLWDYRLNQ